MKKYLKSASLYMAMLAVAGVFAACGDDDDKGASASVAPTPVLTDANGNAVQVTQVGNLSFNYNENGQLASFSTGYETYTLVNNSFTIYDEDEGLTTTVALGSNGYIAQISAGIDVSYGSQYDKESIVINYAYNAAGQLVGGTVTASGSWNYVDDGEVERGSGRASGQLTATWTNNNLVQTAYTIRSISSGYEDGQAYNEDDTDAGSYVYTYGSEANPARQFPYFLSGGLALDMDESFGTLCLLGLFGVGPANLPTGYVEVESDGDDSREYTHTLSFVMNDNGTIRSETRDRYYTLSYNYANTRAAVEADKESITLMVKGLSTKLLHRK